MILFYPTSIEIMAWLGDFIPEDWEARTDILYRITEYDYEEKML